MSINESSLSQIEDSKVTLAVHFIVPFVSIDDPGSGNPAAVCIVPENTPLSEATMSNIARELNQPETIFARFRSPGKWEIRNYTPSGEPISPGGNGSVALAWLLLSQLDRQPKVVLKCAFPWLDVKAELAGSEHMVSVTLPSVPPWIVTEEQRHLIECIVDGPVPDRIVRGERDVIIVYQKVEDIVALRFDLDRLLQARIRNELPFFAVIATAPTDSGFAYRTFVIGAGREAFECPGSAAGLYNLPSLHDSLGYGKEVMLAEQLSERGGIALCRLLGHHVELIALCEQRCGQAQFAFPIMGGELDWEPGADDPFIWI